jgi:hypothetical protein
MQQQETLVVQAAVVVVSPLLLVVLQIKVALVELVMAMLVAHQIQLPQAAVVAQVAQRRLLSELLVVLAALEQVCFLLGVALLEQVKMSAEPIILLAVELETELVAVQHLALAEQQF